MRTYKLQEKIVDNTRCTLLWDLFDYTNPESRLIIDKDYSILRFIQLDMLYYVHIENNICVKVCVYKEII